MLEHAHICTYMYNKVFFGKGKYDAIWLRPRGDENANA